MSGTGVCFCVRFPGGWGFLDLRFAGEVALSESGRLSGEEDDDEACDDSRPIVVIELLSGRDLRRTPVKSYW